METKSKSFYCRDYKKNNKRTYNISSIESIAYQVADLLEKVKQQENITITNISVDGGASKNNFLMQLQADLLQTELIKNTNEVLSVIGAMYLGGMASGIWSSIEQLKKLNKIDHKYIPNMNLLQQKKLLTKWRQVIQKELE